MLEGNLATSRLGGHGKRTSDEDRKGRARGGKGSGEPRCGRPFWKGKRTGQLTIYGGVQGQLICAWRWPDGGGKRVWPVKMLMVRVQQTRPAWSCRPRGCHVMAMRPSHSPFWKNFGSTFDSHALRRGHGGPGPRLPFHEAWPPETRSDSDNEPPIGCILLIMITPA